MTEYDQRPAGLQVIGEESPLAGSNDADAVARELARSLADRPRLAALMAVAVTVLERNLTVEAIVEAKREWIEASLRLVNALHAAVPALSVERCRELLQMPVRSEVILTATPPFSASSTS